jgi:hypothetical protein
VLFLQPNSLEVISQGDEFSFCWLDCISDPKRKRVLIEATGSLCSELDLIDIINRHEYLRRAVYAVDQLGGRKLHRDGSLSTA